MKKILISVFMILFTFTTIGFNNEEVNASDSSATRSEVIIEIGKLLELENLPIHTIFKDVPFYHEASGYIQSAVDLGIVNGYSEDTFNPNGQLTRGHIVLFISRAFGDKLPKGKSTFKDLKPNDLYYNVVGQLVNAGIISGYPDGTFKPNNTLTKEHMNLIITRTKNYLDENTEYGSVNGTVVWKYNNYIGTVADVGARVFLFSTDRKYPNYTKQELFDWLDNKREISGVYSTIVDSNGNYKFDKIPVGKYIAVISSKNTKRNVTENLIENAELKSIFGDYNYEVFEANMMTLYKHIYKVIEVKPNSPSNFSNDFGLTYF